MDQLANVQLAIDKEHAVPHMALDCEPGLGGLNQVNEPTHPTPSAQSFCVKNNNIFTRCTSTNQFDVLMTAVANVRKRSNRPTIQR